MENKETAEQRPQTRKRKLKRRVKRIFFTAVLFLALILGGGVFLANQFIKSITGEANEMETELSDNSMLYDDDNFMFESFEGAESQFGELNVLLIGNDARKDEDQARSDALMIGHYDQNTNKVKLVSLMRDMYVEIPGYGMHKFNAAFSFGGPELVRQTLKYNFDVDVQHYAIVNFEGFAKIADVIAPDGIEVDIPYDMSHGIGMMLEKGTQKLNGDQLLAYVRFRHDINSDFGRVQRQQEALSKLKEEALSVNTLFNLPKMMKVIAPYIDTNIDSRTIFTIGKGLMTGGKAEEMETFRIPAEGTFTDRRVNVGEVLVIDLDANRRMLKEFLMTDEEIKEIEKEDLNEPGRETEVSW